MSRWTAALAMLLVSLISYIDRSTLALLAPTILRETHLTGEQYGFIISAFSIAYMIANPLWGWILDRAGLRRGMAAAVAWWTVASAAHAFASGFWSFGAARAALGFGEGATFPGGLRAVVQSLPAEQRGRGLAVAYSGGSLGALVTPLVVTPIFLWWGWRAAFWFTGIIGAGWLLLWSIVSRRPDIRAPKPLEQAATARPRLRDPQIWAFISAYALGALPLAFVLYSAALYLAHPMGRSQEFIGKVLWIPPLGWEVGYFFWGWILDRSLRKGQARLPALARMLTVCVVLNVFFLTIPWVSEIALVLGFMYLAMFVAAGFVVVSVSYATHVYSSAHAGLIAGLGAGSWSLVVALAMPYFGRLFDLHRYSAAFAIAAGVPVVGYAGWQVLRSRPVASAKYFESPSHLG
jgi:ACS family hexuronate transporter-like MFS transporter